METSPKKVHFLIKLSLISSIHEPGEVGWESTSSTVTSCGASFLLKLGMGAEIGKQRPLERGFSLGDDGASA